MARDWDELTDLVGSREFLVERVRLADSGVAVEGPFAPPPLARLSGDEQVFLAAFARSHGSIKRMEEWFGVSYPTVKNRLNRIAEVLEFSEPEPFPAATSKAADTPGTESGRAQGHTAAVEPVGSPTAHSAPRTSNPSEREDTMASEQKLILQMVREGRLTVDEAERLLAVTPSRAAPIDSVPLFARGTAKRRRRHRWGGHGARTGEGAGFLRIEIDESRPEGRVERMRFKVPLKLLRAGINLSGLLPRAARERMIEALRQKGIDVDPFALHGMEPEEMAEILGGLDFELDGAHIRVRRVGDEEEVDAEADAGTDAGTDDRAEPRA